MTWYSLNLTVEKNSSYFWFLQNSMIRKAKLSDLDVIYQLTQACAREMIAKGIFQWNEQYPTRSRFQKDIELQELYVLKEDIITGIIVITELMDNEYIPIQWMTENQRNLYIHRLAVHPDYWGQGYAKQLMSWAENYAKKNEYQSVRLDTFSQNQRNQKFYETRGYKKLGNIFFPKQSEHPFYCYELIL